MRITILIDRPHSWFAIYGKRLEDVLSIQRHSVQSVYEIEEVDDGDCLFLLSCGKVVGPDILKLNTHNIIVHASKLPHGRGFAPLSWQILEGKRNICFTLFEAREEVDKGEIYLQEELYLKGYELIDEWQKKSAELIISMITSFIKMYKRDPNLKGRHQKGESSWYNRRKLQDSELDLSQSIANQFNLLRIVDNKTYPAFFLQGGKYYVVYVTKERETCGVNVDVIDVQRDMRSLFFSIDGEKPRKKIYFDMLEHRYCLTVVGKEEVTS